MNELVDLTTRSSSTSAGTPATLDQTTPAELSQADSNTTELPTRELIGLLAKAEGADELGRVATYRVLKLLGQGGMGVVFQAEDDRDRR